MRVHDEFRAPAGAVRRSAVRIEPLVCLRGLTMSDEDAAALFALANCRKVQKGARLHRGDWTAGSLNLLYEGFAKSVRTVLEGEQQTLALFVAGDLLDAPSFVLGAQASTVVALTAIGVIELPHPGLRNLMRERPHVAEAISRRMAQDRAVLEEWIVGLGRRSALKRAAHLMCEIIARLGAGRTGEAACCPLPLSQSELADVLGLSPVHVNRVLQKLRSDGGVELSHGMLVVKDLGRLERIAGFDAGYLDRGSAWAQRGDARSAASGRASAAGM